MAGSIVRIAIVQTTRVGTARPDLGLGVGYLKAFLESKRPNRYKIDVFESNDFLSNTTNLDAYDLVGISSVSNQYQVAKEVGRMLKEESNGRKSITVIGGAHISALPETMGSMFDYGIVGEGEQTFLELVEALDNDADDNEVLSIAGVIGKREGTLIHGPTRRLIERIDDIPFPDRSYFNKYKSIPALIAARGCPFSCDFCTNRIIWGRAVRRVSPDRVVDELIEITQVVGDVKVIVFRDDIMFLTEDYLTQVLDIMKRRAPNLLEIPKVGYAHVNTLTGSMVDKLKEFGLAKIACGFESASPKILNILKQGSATVDDNQKAINLCSERGLPISGTFIVGLPEESEEDVRMTYEFILRNVQSNKLGFGGINILTPFPGTRYWDILAATEGNLDQFDWNRLDELGFLTYYENKHHLGTIRDWWEERERNRNIYLGGTPKDRFIQILEEYEPELTNMQLEFLKQDRKY